MNRLGRTAVNLAVLTASIAVAGLVAELVLRRVVDLPLVRVEPEVRYDSHPLRRFTLRPNQSAHTYGAHATIDDEGFRANRTSSTDDGARSVPLIVALGDSFTFGLGVNDDETWPAQLQQQLRDRLCVDVSVLNAGTISYGVFQEMDLLVERVLPKRPTVVVHALYWNDYMNASGPENGEAPALTSDGYFTWDGVGQGGTRGWISRLSNRSALLFTLKSLVRQAVPGTPVAKTDYGLEYDRLLSSGLDEPDWAPIAQFYRDFKSLGEQQGFAPVAVIMPVVDLDRETNLYSAHVKGILQEVGIPYLDGFEVWAKHGLRRDQFLPQGPDAHLNAEGYRWLAAAIADTLIAQPEIPTRLADNDTTC